MIGSLRTVFFAAWGIGMASVAFGIVEWISVRAFRLWPFRVGFLLYRSDENDLRSWRPFEPGVRGETETARFKAVDERTILFDRKWQPFGFQTPFPGKCTLSIEPGRCRTVARAPVWTTLFLAAWLVAWVDVWQPFVLAWGILGVGAFMAIGIVIERSRARRMAAEVTAEAERRWVART